MSIFQKIFGSKKTESSVSYSVYSDSDIPRINHYSRILKDVSVASNAVDKVAVAAMGTSPVCKENGVVVKTTADVLLDKPNNESSGDELIYKIVEDIYLGGFSFVVFVGNINQKPIELHRIDPRKVSIETDSFEDEVSYSVLNDKYQGVYKKDPNTDRFLNQNNQFLEILKVKYPSGRSILDSCRDEINVLSVGLAKNGQLIRNGGRMSMLLLFKDHVSQPEMEARIGSINRAVRSKSGYGGLLGVNSGENGVEVKEMGLTPKDMDFLQLQENCRREVYFRCGIPLPLIDNSAATDNNMAAAKAQFYTETVIPMCDLIYSQIGGLVALREKKKYSTLTNQTLIPAVREQILLEVEKRKNIGVETINEIRGALGLEDIDNGDQVFIEARMVALGDNQQALG